MTDASNHKVCFYTSWPLAAADDTTTTTNLFSAIKETEHEQNRTMRDCPVQLHEYCKLNKIYLCMYVYT